MSIIELLNIPEIVTNKNKVFYVLKVTQVMSLYYIFASILLFPVLELIPYLKTPEVCVMKLPSNPHIVYYLALLGILLIFRKEIIERAKKEEEKAESDKFKEKTI